MELKTRRIVHTGVTKYPTDEWTAQQLREATPWGKGPKYLIRDRDSKYATEDTFQQWQLAQASRSWKNTIIERQNQANGICERFMARCVRLTIV
jgi:putative transposase